MSIGPLQIVLIVVVVLIIFGAGKLPRVMGDMGKGIKSFKKGLNGDDDEQSKSADSKSDNKDEKK